MFRSGKRFAILAFMLLSFISASLSFGASQYTRESIHWSGNKTRWFRKKNVVELVGDAVINQPKQVLKADRMILNLNTRVVNAYGNCVYRSGETVIFAKEIHFNLDSEKGRVIGGRVTNGRFLLLAGLIEKRGRNKYFTKKAEYTTCWDCSPSWSFEGEDVDLEFEGYGYMHNVFAKVKGSPVFWMPYLVIPLKTERQTGLLFPRFGFTGLHGFQFVQPFFWAINRSMDVTLGGGTYSRRGWRGEGEARYALGPKSKGKIEYFRTQDKQFGEVDLTTGDLVDPKGNPLPNRWGLRIEQSQQFPLGIEQRLRYLDISDTFYTYRFSDDINSGYQPVLTSELIFTRASDDVSGFLEVKRFRNLLNNDSVEDFYTFDPDTVQLMPRAELTTNDQFLESLPIAFGFNVGVSNFTRAGPSFDYDSSASVVGDPFTPGVDPIREAVRFTANPSVYTTIRPFDTLSVVPRAEYRGFYYDFRNVTDDLARGYLLLQTDVSMQFEKIYNSDNKTYPKYKHVIRPNVRYSLIPVVNENPHPFLDQIESRTGYNFDNQDIIPLSQSPSLTNYFVPQGHSVSYGLSTQLIRKKVDPDNTHSTDATYQNIAEVEMGQTLDIMQFQEPENTRVPLSRFFTNARINFDQMQLWGQYYYYPYLSRLIDDPISFTPSPHEVSSALTYILERGMRQEILNFDRSITVGYSFRKTTARTSSLWGAVAYSLSDYILPKAHAHFDFVTNRFLGYGFEGILQSPSRCWKFSLRMEKDLQQFRFSFNFDLNLTGSGFTSFQQLAEGSTSAN